MIYVTNYFSFIETPSNDFGVNVYNTACTTGNPSVFEAVNMNFDQIFISY